MNRYINTQTVPAPALPAAGYLGGPRKPVGVVYSSSTVSFNQVPDKLIIFLKKGGNLTSTDSDSFLPITNININWNNSSGIGTSYSQSDLWKMSVQAGSNQTWDEFRGHVNRATLTADTTAGAGAGLNIATCGSLLVLNMGQHIPIIEDYLAPGSIGNFTFMIRVTAENWGDADITPDLYVCTMNSGAFALERGTSSTYTALLTKDDCLNAVATQVPISNSELTRMVGGGFLDSLKTAYKWLANPQHRADIGKVIRTGLDIHDTYKGKEGHDKSRKILTHLGGSRSGGSNGIMNRLK